MNVAAFSQTVQRDMVPLIEGIFGELRSNPGTSHYHRLGNDELLRRGQNVYQQMLSWLSQRDPAAVQKAGTELGIQRFAEGIPLGQVVLALLLEEKHLWKHPATAALATDAELVRAVGEFFQEFIYWTARGFAAELSSGQTPPGRVVPPPPHHMPTQKAAQHQEADELITRGGQIAEFGG